MSIRLHAFRAKDQENLYLQIKLAKLLVSSWEKTAEREGIEFQIFETSKGIIYRVLEAGYGLQNKMWKYPEFFPICNYDDRVEIPDEETANEAIADEVDILIHARKYSIVPVVPISDVRIVEKRFALAKANYEANKDDPEMESFWNGQMNCALAILEKLKGK